MSDNRDINREPHTYVYRECGHRVIYREIEKGSLRYNAREREREG